MIELCKDCKGTGKVDKIECNEGGGNNGSDYTYVVKAKCKKCEGSGRVEIITTVVEKPYKEK